MDLIRLKEELLKIGANIGLQVEEENQNNITLHATLVAKDYYQDSIYLRITVFSSGTFHMFLTFNTIETTYDNLFLINHFNAENPWFKAYVANLNNKDFLELHFVALSLKEVEDALDTFGFLMNELLSEETTKFLNTILNISKID